MPHTYLHVPGDTAELYDLINPTATVVAAPALEVPAQCLAAGAPARVLRIARILREHAGRAPSEDDVRLVDELRVGLCGDGLAVCLVDLSPAALEFATFGAPTPGIDLTTATTAVALLRCGEAAALRRRQGARARAHFRYDVEGRDWAEDFAALSGWRVARVLSTGDPLPEWPGVLGDPVFNALRDLLADGFRGIAVPDGADPSRAAELSLDLVVRHGPPATRLCARFAVAGGGHAVVDADGCALDALLGVLDPEELFVHGDVAGIRLTAPGRIRDGRLEPELLPG